MIHDNEYIELLFILMFYNNRRNSLRASSYYNKHLSIYIISLISNKLGVNILYTHKVTCYKKNCFS